ncbi:diguanylate cyclase domain-containing protein [Deinococcus lacus]|uniref:Diguanylate cyclase domain-containing protein n=1 Tax=Deinococcus lacus TaxID=392561 RepID=A0ABW1YEC6_9DEIO
MILIIDDSPTAQRTLARSLLAHGLGPCLTPRTLDEARQILGFGHKRSEVDVDVVLLDMVMPETDGLTFLQEIRAQPHLRDLAVIIVTALEDEQQLEWVFATGANDYLSKPPLPVVLAGRVRNAQSATWAMRLWRTRERELSTLALELQTANNLLEATTDRLKALSMTDSLTNLPNRRAFDLLLTRELEVARRGTPLGLLMIDVDVFKNYNDHFGHSAGDRCLSRVAQAIQSSIRLVTDSAARYGGEEFVALLPGADAEQTREIAERIRETVYALNLPHPAYRAGRVTVSVGGASLGGPQLEGPASANLMAYADEALYAAKRTGRNRVMVASGKRHF